jgi:uncharacterized protein YkwD
MAAQGLAMATRGRIGRAIGLAVFAVLLVGIIPAAQATTRPHRACPAGNPSGQALFMATNRARLGHQVPGLTVNRRLSNLARLHSRAMAAQHRMYHSPNPNTYLRGINWSTWGENVGYTTGDAASVQRAFMQSLIHRHNILDSRFHHVAIGAVRVGGTLWVTVFFYG